MAVAAFALTPSAARADASADSLPKHGSRAWKTRDSFGVRYTHPQRVAVSFAHLWLHEAGDDDVPRGWFVQAEPGSGGGRLSAGWCMFAAAEKENFSLPALAVGLKGSVLRTWGSPLGAASNTTLIGPELDFALLYWKGSIGLLWPVSSSGTQQERLTTWGIGFGF